MRVGTLTAGLLAGAFVCVTALAAPALADGKISIPMNGKTADKAAPKSAAANVQTKSQAKPQIKPKAQSAKRQAARQAARKAERRAALRHAKRQRASHYDYAAAQPVHPGGWRRAWLAHRGMRDVGYAPPAAYGPPVAPYYEPGIEIDRGGWTGGVGYGTSGDFVDGYGMMHYGWGNRQNGPTYNSYSQSFQHNPSVAGPFQPRRMGQPIPAR